MPSEKIRWMRSLRGAECEPLAEYQRRRQDLEQKQHALAAQEAQLEAQVDRQGKLASMVTSIEEFCQGVRSG
jgi:site-specific DNA recombinase